MKITLKSVLVVAMLLLIATCKKDEKTVTVFEVIDLQVSDNSVRINGKITSLSGNNITDYGICYSVKNNSPVATDTALHLGVPEVGAFSATINNLQRNKTYYFRGFIREAGQYLYDDVRSAKIEAVAPSAITAAAGSIAESSAVLNGSVNANGVSTTVSFEYGTTTAYGNVINAAPNPLTGTSASNVSANLAGLASNTTYHYRVRAVNAAGTVTGEDVSFTTTINLVAPAATTTAASSVTNTTATINGSVNANGSNTTISFEYGNSFLYGSVISASPSTASSIVPVIVSASLTGLTPGQLYHFRVKAVSAGGTTNGEDFTFTTTQPPAATTNDASNTGANSATLNGAVNAFGISANIYFEYGTTASYGTIAAADPSSSSASSSVASKLDLTGLAENTTYHFRIKAVSAGGTSYGTDHVFTTSVSASLPVMYTELVTDITQTAASCGGTVTSDGGGAIIAAGVCWSTTSPPLVSGNKTTDPVSSGTFTSNITGLTAGTTYYIRSYATNSAGTGYGPERSFSTATAIAIPTITTSAVTDITQTSAVSGGNISSDGGDAITASGVCWNTSANPTISNNKTLDGSTIGAFISNITGLTPGVTYYVRSYATNSAGTAYGSQVSFATQAASIDLPTLSTAAITSITQTSASSGGNVISQGGAAVTARGVCWNTSPDPTISNSKTSDGNGTGSFTSSLTSLSASTTYYVRAYATNASGTAYGNTQTFTTNSVVTQSASTSAASSITQTTATFNGTVNANGLSVTVTFEYGLTTSYGSNITASGSPVSGSITTAVTANVTGLSANTQYNYRIKTVSSSGTVYGDNQTFSTLAGVLPTVTTVSPVTGITTSGASGGGNVTVQGSSAVTARGVCWSTGLNPTTANSKTTNGTGTGAFTSSITGLIANTLYHVRAYATNSTGTAYGDDVTFTTSAVVVAPTVTTASVSPGITTASTGGNVTLDGGASVTARGVCYGTSASPDITGLKTTDGTGTGSFTSNLAGLTGSTTYHVRAYATNSAGTAYGNDIQFTTNAAAVVPTVSTADISAITTSSASSGGNVTFDGNATVTARGICWGTSVNPTTSNSTFPDGSGTGTFTGDMTALSPGTTYHVRAYATNSAGTGYGNDISFATLCIQPSASTSVATGVTATTATLNGNINANNFSTNVTFDYGLTTGYGTTVAGSPASVTGSAGTAVTASISGLLPNTLYHFRVNGANCAGTVNGSDLTFTTPCTTATATVNTPTGVAATSAT
ncbi:MAG TPA: hypothetical protein VK155_18830, partial [Bacteroidales bacterium]|nr:hypothetical protein [Bacteroidales bacterium]